MNASLVKLSFFLILLVCASGLKFETKNQDAKINDGTCKTTDDCGSCVCGQNGCRCCICVSGQCICTNVGGHGSMSHANAIH
ncbi:hypothetical protein Lalb_Chr01g0019051 [Lupinus albus]|uniref:Uncharacterized protein n=1 Tax=Lupinus albus TaxID=3870 RepID=A0A6A4R7G7_LUPAL|nr:hypothetical protein Lalb_Chr01g0019051 [Lupinus albus]